MTTTVKCGLEIHQRLDTHKLFCNCYADANKQITEKDVHITRKLRSITGELGTTDVAALFEASNDKSYEYTCGEKTSCLVESDDEPPRLVNEEALQIALQIAKTLNAKIVNEVHVMRKSIIDGSTVSGFQRTALIALNGKIVIDGKKIGIGTISLEEESCRIIERQEAKRAAYGVDRLGIPLVEITTDPDIESPELAKKVALELGEILRNTGKVQRGLGTIRQDVNISIPEGQRIEIKGCQDLEAIDDIVKNEISRQHALLDLREKLNSRKARIDGKIIDVSKIFQNTSSKLIANGIAGGAKVLAIKLDGFCGAFATEILPGFTFGKEVNDHAKLAGVKGILHTDENLEKVGITLEERKNLEDLLNAGGENAFVICVDNESTSRRALQSVIERCKQALQGVPAETRKTDDKNTRFMRPLAGAGRLYPETDLPPRIITTEELATLPKVESPADKVKRYETLGLNEELARRMASHPKYKLFEEITSKTKCDASTAAVTILETLTALRREGVKVDDITDDKLVSSLEEYGESTIAKPGIAALLKILSTDADIPVSKAISQSNLQRIEGESLKKIVVELKGNIAEIMKKYKVNIEPSQLNKIMADLKQNGKIQ